jgi:hypothetical protein
VRRIKRVKKVAIKEVSDVAKTPPSVPKNDFEITLSGFSAAVAGLPSVRSIAPMAVFLEPERLK